MSVKPEPKKVSTLHDFQPPRVIWWRLGQWVAPVLLSGIVFGLAVFLLWIQPREATGANYPVEFAWYQLVASVVAAILVILFGGYTVEQVRIAREGLEQERRVDRCRIESETRRVLGALLNELDQNRTTALNHEGRLRIPEDLVMDIRMEFRRDIYDGLRAGPIWSVPGSEAILPTLEQAYWEMKVLTDKLRTRPLWKTLMVGIFVVDLSVLVQRAPAAWISRQANGARGAVLVHVLMLFARPLLVHRQGYPAQTREAIETAMQATHRLLYKEPIDWEIWNNLLPAGFQVSPLKAAGAKSKAVHVLDPILDGLLWALS